MNGIRTMRIAASGDRDIIITRSFNARRELVWDALTKPELLKRWLFGPDGWSLEVCEIDLRVGGAYRYVWRHKNGHTMGMGGVYREVVPPTRTVCTELFDEAWFPGESIVTIELKEHEGATTLTQTLRYESREARDGVLKSPMEEGMRLGYDRLDGVLESMTPSAS